MVRNNVQVLGKGQRLLMFAHGFGSNQSVWKAQVEAFAQTHRIILFDHVGATGTNLAAYSPHRYASLESYASDMIEVLDAVGAQDVLYVGHSMSGMAGLLAGLARPGLFRGMVFIGASPRYLNTPGYVGGFERADLDALYAAMEADFGAWASGFGRAVAGASATPEVAESFVRTLGALRPDVALGVARVLFESDLREQVPKLTLPTWILQPSKDLAVPLAVGDYLASHLPRGRLSIVDNEGHLPHLTRPGQVNALLAEIFAGL